ncbi:hypothetical protein JVU11DRAFT_8473 [Chiua virens]|nr:hypothetical protein JVU11DRAFT_8473 [Chiua virens]
MPQSSPKNQEDSQEKYEFADLKRVLEEVMQARGALERERNALQTKITHADGQREVLMETIEDLLSERAAYKQEKEESQRKHENELADLRRLLEEATQAREELERQRSGISRKFRAGRVANEQEGELQKKLAKEVVDRKRGPEAAAQPRENVEPRKRHAKKLAQPRDVDEVPVDSEEAVRERYEGLRTVLNTECEVLVKKLLRTEQDQGRLMKILDEQDLQQQRLVWWWSVPE